jgi:hypothetical protein
MTRREKLLAGIRNNPKGVRFQDACKAAELIGFVRTGGKGSHVVHARAGESMILTFQDRGGHIPPYQARQLIAMMDKYED